MSATAETRDLAIDQIAESLRTARRSRGLTLEGVSKTLNVALSTVHKWETGETKISAAQLQKYADVLGYTPNAIMSRVGREELETEVVMHDEELALLRTYRALPERQQAWVREFIRVVTKGVKS